MIEDVPADFPQLLSMGAVSGAQAKLPLNQATDGTFSEIGNSLEERRYRYEACLRIMEWAIPFLLSKVLKPKYACMPKAQILAWLQINLDRDFGLVEADQRWVRAKVAERLGWIYDLTTSA